MMKWKIGVALVLLILFLPMIANAEEITKVYSMSDIIAFKKQGWKASTDIWFDIPTQSKIGNGGIVGKNIMIEGGASVTLTKNNQTLDLLRNNLEKPGEQISVKRSNMRGPMDALEGRIL